MFDQLFSCPRAIQRYLTAPLLEPRLRYLNSCAAEGLSTESLKKIALYQRYDRSIDELGKGGEFPPGTDPSGG